MMRRVSIFIVHPLSFILINVETAHGYFAAGPRAKRSGNHNDSTASL